MELIFLSAKDLSVIDYGFANDDFEIVLDYLVPQKATFIINKSSLKAKTGDLITTRDNHYGFIGILTNLEKNDDGTIKVNAVDYLNILDVEVPISTYNGSCFYLLRNCLRRAYFDIDDYLQKKPYLTFECEDDDRISLSFEEDESTNLLELLKTINKASGLFCSYEIIIKNGSFYQIKLVLKNTKKDIAIREDIGAISNIKIKDSNDKSLNKIIFYPKDANVSYTKNVSYFLTKDGKITTNKNDPKRIENVVYKMHYYADKEYSSLATKASKELMKSGLDHNITFDLDLKNNKNTLLSELSLGTYVIFLGFNKVYHTIVSKIVYKGGFDTPRITLGEARTNLTEKLKLNK